MLFEDLPDPKLCVRSNMHVWRFDQLLIHLDRVRVFTARLEMFGIGVESLLVLRIDLERLAIRRARTLQIVEVQFADLTRFHPSVRAEGGLVERLRAFGVFGLEA